MNLLSNLSYSNWRGIHIALVIVLSLILLFAGSSIKLMVSDTIVDVFYIPFYTLRAYVEEVSNVNDRNQNLAAELAETALELSFHREFARENERLRQILDFEHPTGYRLLQAKVISITGSGVPISAVINCGLDDSVMVNMPVINRFGLVGRVESAMLDNAEVQLLTDPRNRVAVRVASSREMGIVRHLPSEGMLLTAFPNQGKVAVGDTVVSSGLGGIYPPGVQVGIVSGIIRPENQPDAIVHLQPVVNFRSIEQLFVLIPEDKQ